MRSHVLGTYRIRSDGQARQTSRFRRRIYLQTDQSESSGYRNAGLGLGHIAAQCWQSLAALSNLPAIEATPCAVLCSGGMCRTLRSRQLQTLNWTEGVGTSHGPGRRDSRFRMEMQHAFQGRRLCHNNLPQSAQIILPPPSPSRKRERVLSRFLTMMTGSKGEDGRNRASSKLVETMQSKARKFILREKGNPSQQGWTTHPY